jgi:hypothetical protein
MSEEIEMLGVWLLKSDKEAIRKIARGNRMSISDMTRILISYGLKNINKQNILKLE